MSFGPINGGEDDAPMADINVTPLVDVMLVLLIVFMITMPVLTHSIPLSLPTTSQNETEQPKDIKPLTIAVDAEGNYVIGVESQSKVDLETVSMRLKEAAEQNPDTVVAIAADKQVAYDYVAQLLEAARKSGLSKIGFMTEIETSK